MKNKNKYADISRAELATIKSARQRGLFASFSPEQKVKIFQEKYQYLMGLESLSEKEKNHLTVLFQQLTPNVYSSQTTDKAKFLEFADKWVDEAKDVLGWSDYDVFRYTHTCLTNEEFEQWLVAKKQESTLKSTRSEGCDCNTQKGNLYNECGSYYAHCSSRADCNSSSMGCGFLWLEKCDGYCMEN